MRLLTLNLLECNGENCSGGYPLRLTLEDSADATSVLPQDLDPHFIRKMLKRIDYKSFYEVATNLGYSLPPQFDESDLENENFIQCVHDALLNLHILKGKLVCPSCSREYRIREGKRRNLISEFQGYPIL